MPRLAVLALAFVINCLAGDLFRDGDENRKPHPEQHTISDQPKLWNPAMITGDPEWFDYTL